MLKGEGCLIPPSTDISSTRTSYSLQDQRVFFLFQDHNDSFFMLLTAPFGSGQVFSIWLCLIKELRLVGIVPASIQNVSGLILHSLFHASIQTVRNNIIHSFIAHTQQYCMYVILSSGQFIQPWGVSLRWLSQIDLYIWKMPLTAKGCAQCIVHCKTEIPGKATMENSYSL